MVACRFAPGRCSYKKAAQPLSLGRSTRPGCEGCLPVRTEAVLLQKGGQPPPPVGAPAPGAKGACRFAPRRCSYNKAGQPLPGCDGCGADARRQNFLQQGLDADARTSSGELIY